MLDRPVYLDAEGRPTLRRPAPFVARWQDGGTLVTLAMGAAAMPKEDAQ